MLLALAASLCLTPLGTKSPGLVKLSAPKIADAVVYEANLRALGPSGGFVALTKRLDEIHALGANVLWLMPIQPVGKIRSAGGLGSPYSVADYDRVNPEFGTSEEFQRLVQEAHRRKIAVVLDWVANHTAWDNPWLKAHPEWYTHDAQGNITIPAGTNWQDVADLNFDNPELRNAMIASMKGWIDRYGIDGFRVDAADFVPFDFWKTAVPSLRKSTSKPLFMLAEGFRSDHYTAGFDLTYGWNFFNKLKGIYGGGKASELAAAAASESKGIPAGARRLRFITNHDVAAWEGTFLDYFKSGEGTRTAFAITALYGGTPLIYSGQEAAWPNRIPIFERSSIDWGHDPKAAGWITQLMKLRREHPALREGSTEDASTDDAVVFRRKLGRDEVLVLANIRDREVSVPMPSFAGGKWSEAWTGKPLPLGASASLPPYGTVVYLRKS